MSLFTKKMSETFKIKQNQLSHNQKSLIAKYLLFLFSLATLIGFKAHSQVSSSQQGITSNEIMCRNKAKELAAETYKNCVTEYRQGQVEKIRGEYQKKLEELKKHYDGELKKLAQGKSTTESPKAVENQPLKNAEAQVQLKKDLKSNATYIPRSSGARELPSQLNSNNGYGQKSSDDYEADQGATKNMLPSNTVEIVEIPVQED